MTPGTGPGLHAKAIKKKKKGQLLHTAAHRYIYVYMATEHLSQNGYGTLEPKWQKHLSQDIRGGVKPSPRTVPAKRLRPFFSPRHSCATCVGRTKLMYTYALTYTHTVAKKRPPFFFSLGILHTLQVVPGNPGDVRHLYVGGPLEIGYI